MIIALVGAFSVIVQLHQLIDLRHYSYLSGIGKLMEIFEFKFKVRKMYCYWGWYVVIFNDWVRVKYSKIKINHMVNTKPHRGTCAHCSYRNEKLSSLIATSLQVTYYYVLFSVFSPCPMAGVVLRENINMGCGQENTHFSVQLNNI